MINFKDSSGKIKSPYNGELCAIKVDFKNIKFMDVGSITNDNGNYDFVAKANKTINDYKNDILESNDIFKNPITLVFKVIDCENNIYEELISGVRFFINNYPEFLYIPNVPYTMHDLVDFVNDIKICGLFYKTTLEEIYKVGDEAKYLFFNEALSQKNEINEILKLFHNIEIDNIDFCCKYLLDQIREIEYTDEVIKSFEKKKKKQI